MKLPGGTELLRADFSRDGFDLILEHPDHGTLVLPDYFLRLKPPALETVDGAVLKTSVVRALAGPMTPGQTAQLSIDGIDTGMGTTDAATMGEPIGSVSEAEGAVTVLHPDGTESMLTQGDAIYQGDVLETGKDGAVSVVFIDDTVFSLDNDGRMVMDEMVYDPDTQTGVMKAEVVQGVFSFVSGQVAKTSPDGMEISTPTATIGIRGSTVLGEAGGEGNQNNVTLVPDVDGNVGEVVLSNGAGSQVLNQPGASVTLFSFNAPPPPPVILSSQEIQQNFGASLTRLVKTVAKQAEQKTLQAEQRAEQASAAKDEADAAKEEADAAKEEADQALAEAEASGDPEAIAAAEAAAAEAEAEAAAAAAAAEEAAQAEAEAQAQAQQAQAFSSLASTAATVQEDAFAQVAAQDAGETGQQGEQGDGQEGDGPTDGPDTGRTDVIDTPPPPPPDPLPVEPPPLPPQPAPPPPGGDDETEDTVITREDTVNLAPTGSPGVATLNEDGSYTGNLLASITDPDGDTLSFSIANLPAKGSLTRNADGSYINADGTFTYTPSANENGHDAFTFKVNDGNGHEVTFTQNLSITGIADAPEVTMSTTSGTIFGMSAGQSLSAYDITDIHATDFDGDGDQDILFTHYTGSGYDVMLGTNDGSGGFTVSTTGVTSTGKFFEIGDVDNDGLDDIVMGQSGTGTAPVFFQNNDGSFSQTAQQLDTTYMYQIELADMNGDGLLDIVAARTSSGAQPNKIFLNNSGSVAGQFVDSGQSLANNDTKSVAVGDLDNDGHQDAVFGNWDGVFEVHLNNGDGTGTMAAGENVSTGGSTLGVALGDLDGDGYLDAFLANRYVGNMVFTNDGDGTFTDTGQVLGVTTHEHEDVVLADIDGDGDLDAIVGNYNSYDQIWLNDGNANFTEAGLNIGSGIGYGVAVADFDGDGNLDIALGHNAGTEGGIYLNDTVHYNESMTQGGSFVLNAGGTTHLSASDPDGTASTFTYTVTAIPAGGSVKLNGTALAVSDTFTQADLDAGNVEYVHAGGSDTADAFSFTVFDGSDTSATQTFNIELGPNSAPVFTDPGTITLNEDGSASGTLTATDADGDTLSFSTTTTTVNGTFVLNADGTYTYTPDPDYEGSDTAQIQIDDGVSTTTATVNFSVTAVNDAPDVLVSVVTGPSAAPTGSAGLGFDGVNDYIEVGNTNYDGLTTGTIEAWVYVENFDTSNVILAKQDDGVNTMGVFSIGGTNNNSASTSTQGALVWHGNNTGGNFESTGTITAGQWQHVAIAFNDTGATFYINGVAAGTVSGTSGDFTIPSDTNSTTTIGNLIAGGSATDQTNAFDGFIADVRIWNTERTGTDISNNYQSTLTGSETGLVGYWPLDTVTNGTVADATSNADDGVLGSATVGDLSEPSDLANANLSVLTNTTTTLSASHLSASDVDIADASTDFIYTVTAVPSHGALKLNGTALAVNDTFLQSDIDGGNVTYVSTGMAAGPDQFQFTVSDGTAASSAQEFTIDIAEDYTNFTVASGDTWTFDGTGIVPTSSLTNDGTVNITAGSVNTPTITNNAGGVINYSSSGLLGGTFTNYGTFNAQAGANQINQLVNYGTINIDAGVTLLAAYNNNPVSSSASVMQGSGTFKTASNGAYTYEGTVNPGTDGTIGAFTFNGWDGLYGRTTNFTSTTVVNIDLQSAGTAGVNFDQLNIINSDASTLTGTLNLKSIGGYTPTSGDTFSSIMTYHANSSGSFATVTHDFGAGWELAVDYGAGAMNVTVLTTAAATTGTTGDDTLLSLASNDTIIGDAGNDVLQMNGVQSDYTWIFNTVSEIAITDTVGTDGTDTVTGVETVRFHGGETVAVSSGLLTFDGSNNAVTLGDAMGSVAFDGGAGTDSLTMADGGNNITVSNFESITGGVSTDTVTLGAAGSSSISAVETINGSSGVDNITIGDATAVTIDLGAGNDALNASSGNDIITGGAGNDTLNSGAGTDTFVYTSTALGSGDLGTGEIDTTDAAAGDSIDLSSTVEGLLQIGATTLSGLASNTALGSTLDANNTIAFTSNQVVLDFDANGTADFTIAVDNTVTGATYDSATDTITLS